MTLHAVHHPVASPLATAVLMHGIGLGPWFWDPWLPHFAAARLSVVALTMPGHELPGRDVTLAGAIAEVEATHDTVEGPVALVGHSMGGLIAQVVASRRRLHAAALVCPLPAGQVRVVPGPAALRGGVRLVRSLLAGRPIVVSWDDYRAIGLHTVEEATAREVYARIVPWPNRLVRDLGLARPRIDALAVTAPVLVAIGRRDRLVHWMQARVLGDLYEGIVWRYDDLGHMPPWEPGGERMGRDLAQWLAAPRRPQVLESEGFTPAEGAGHTLRRQRRGEEMKRRSAYGQKESAR